jgi:amino acid transporter
MFGRVHSTGRFPTVSLIAINAMAIPLCWFSLERLLSALMIIQIVFQFIPQIFAVFAMRKYRTEIQRPYGMWLYPVPALIALVGWIFVASAPEQRQNLGTAGILLVLGLGAYFLRARAVKTWPLDQAHGRSAPNG